jgi:beta-glucanase (GH16 family)
LSCRGTVTWRSPGASDAGLPDTLRPAPRKDKDLLAHHHVPDRRLSRRRLLGGSAAVTVAAAAGVAAAWDARGENVTRGKNVSRGENISRRENVASSRILLNEVFAGQSLNRNHWNPYICDNNSNGRPWLMQPSVAVPSSAIGEKNSFNNSYALPSAIRVDNGLTLSTYRGSKAAGYSWTGSVICSRPTSNNFGSGTVHTAGFTFTDARVDVRAKMPDLTSGQWPAIWFLPAWEDDGAEIDLFEGGFLVKAINSSRLMSVNLMSGGHQQQRLRDCRTDLSADYHTYSMEYRQGTSIKVFFDGLNVCTYTRNVPVGPYFIILSNSIASGHAAHWHTQVSNSTPTINLMQVSYVRVWAL